MRPVHREMPRLPAHAVKTFTWAVPRANKRMATKSEAASGRACYESDCPNYLHGWKTTLSKMLQGALIKTLRESGRKFVAEVDEGEFISFVFEPGTPCFAASKHWVHTGAEDLHVVTEGDWRGNPRGTGPRVMRAPDWLDKFANHQQSLADEVRKG